MLDESSMHYLKNTQAEIYVNECIFFFFGH